MVEPRRSLPTTVDAVVIGGGHHGLVAATTLADAGWDVVLLEARDHVGGAVSSVNHGGWVMDEFSACHPLAVASPIIKALGLEYYGLRWCRSDAVLAHAGSPQDPDGAAIMTDAQATAALLAEDHPADASAWLELVEEWQRIKGPLLDSLLTRWPPVAPGARLVRAIGAHDLARFLRFLMLPTIRMGEEIFQGHRGPMLLAGNAMHADIPPDAPGSGAFGWLMAMLAQTSDSPRLRVAQASLPKSCCASPTRRGGYQHRGRRRTHRSRVRAGTWRAHRRWVHDEGPARDHCRYQCPGVVRPPLPYPASGPDTTVRGFGQSSRRARSRVGADRTSNAMAPTRPRVCALLPVWVVALLRRCWSRPGPR